MSSYKLIEAIKYGAGVLKDSGIERSVFEARIILSYVLSISVEMLILRAEQELSSDDFKRFLELIHRRANHEPIAYILGKKEFYGLEFKVNKNVLIPRPDSETLVEWVLNNYDPNAKIKILELGVGSGCLILTILKHLPNASGVAVDIKSEAIKVAQENYNILNLKNDIIWFDCGWSKLPEFQKKFDLIISNPPYITKDELAGLQSDVRDYEPHSALEGGSDGLYDYREIAPIISNNLTDLGRVILEIGKGQEGEVTRIMKNCGLDVIQELQDLSGIVRCVVLSQTRKV